MPGWTLPPVTKKTTTPAALTKTVQTKPGAQPISYAPGTPESKMVGNYSGSSQSIQFPEFYSLGQGVQDVKDAGVLPTSKPLTGFGDDYYSNLYGQAEKSLNQQYFSGSNNLSDKLKNQMNKRGLIGSGIEAGATTDLYQDFGSQMADVSSKLASERAQNDLSLAQNNRDYDARLSELSLRAASDAQENATNYGTKLFQSQVEAGKTGADKENKILSTLTDLFNSAKAGDSQRGKYASDIQRILDQYFKG